MNAQKQMDKLVADFMAAVVGLAEEAAREKILAQLNGAAPKPKKKVARKKKAARRKEPRPGRVTSFVRSSGKDGMSIGEIAAALGYKGVTSPLRRTVASLLANGSLRKTGERRGTRYHVK